VELPEIRTIAFGAFTCIGRHMKYENLFFILLSDFLLSCVYSFLAPLLSFMCSFHTCFRVFLVLKDAFNLFQKHKVFPILHSTS